MPEMKMRDDGSLEVVMATDALDAQIGGDHYKNMKIQPVEFIQANGLTFLEGCVTKRICRHRSKNGVEDLEKIIHEVRMIAKLEYGKEI